MEPDSYGILIGNVLIAMAERDWSINETARRTGLSQGYLSLMLRGERCPGLHTLDKLAAGLRLHPWELVTPPK